MSETIIGTKPNQVPTNGDLGTLAFQDSTSVIVDSLNVSANITIADRIIHADDDNTQIRFPAADTITVETAGSERLRIDSNGNVGIGTSSPSYKLQINGTISSTVSQTETHTFTGFQYKESFSNHVAQSKKTSNTYAYYWRTSDDGTLGGTNLKSIAEWYNDRLVFYTNNAERMRITATGNVGIGTNSPGHTIHASASSASVNIQDTSNTGAYIALTRGTGAFPASGAASLSQFNGSLFVKNLDTGPVIFTTTSSDTERMRITNDGNVGIGNTAPAHKLRVQGDISLSGGIHANGSLGTSGQILTSNGTAAYWSSGGSGVTSVATGNGLTGGPITSTGTVSVLANTGIIANATGLYVNSAYIGTIASNSATYANASITNTFTVGTSTYFVSNGNVGIGTSSPSKTLHVYGTNATTFIDAQTGTSYPSLWIGGSGTPYFSIDTDLGAPTTGGTLIRTIGGAYPLRFGVDTTERMRIDASGNVGIGTNSPAYKLEVNGSFAATTKSFVIDHPTKPGHKLRYGSLEGPENGVYFRGSSDKTIIDLPDYWSKLVDPESITVSLTAYGVANPELHVVEIKNNKIFVHNNNLKYFFIVYAERCDVEKLQVEVEPDV